MLSKVKDPRRAREYRLLRHLQVKRAGKSGSIECKWIWNRLAWQIRHFVKTPQDLKTNLWKLGRTGVEYIRLHPFHAFSMNFKGYQALFVWILVQKLPICTRTLTCVEVFCTLCLQVEFTDISSLNCRIISICLSGLEKQSAKFELKNFWHEGEWRKCT